MKFDAVNVANPSLLINMVFLPPDIAAKLLLTAEIEYRSTLTGETI